MTLRPSFVKQCCVSGSSLPSPTPPSPELNSREMPRAPVKHGLRSKLLAHHVQVRRTELCKPGANALGVAGRNWISHQSLGHVRKRRIRTGLFVVSVTGGDSQRRVLLAKDVVDPLEKRACQQTRWDSPNSVDRTSAYGSFVFSSVPMSGLNGGRPPVE